jgi:hypothetical protein
LPRRAWKSTRGFSFSPAAIEISGQLSFLTLKPNRNLNLFIQAKVSRFPKMIMSKLKLKMKTKANLPGPSSHTFSPVPLPGIAGRCRRRKTF